MNRRHAAALVASLTLAALLPASPPAAASSSAAPPDRINLPRGWQPEGVTTDGRLLYVGSLANAAIRRIDPRTGQRRTIFPGRRGQSAVGVDHDRRRDLLWVAGGDTPVVRVHDADTGDRLRSYRFPRLAGGFINDLVVTRHGVFATDSFHRRLAVVPLSGRGLPPRRVARTLPLTGAFELRPEFNLNGIVAAKGRLLAVQSNTGKLFRINPSTGRSRVVRVAGGPLTGGDGMERRGKQLFVVRNTEETIAVLELGRRLRHAAVTDEIGSPDFDVPTTAALVRQSLWVVNARFGNPDAPDIRYWLTRVPAPRPVPPR